MKSESKTSIFTSRSKVDDNYHRQQSTEGRHRREVNKSFIQPGKIDKNPKTLHRPIPIIPEIPIPIPLPLPLPLSLPLPLPLPIPPPPLIGETQTSCGANETNKDKSGLDQTKRQGLISAHGLAEELNNPLFTSPINNSRHSQIDVSLQLSLSEEFSPWSTSSCQDQDIDFDIQRVSASSTTPSTTTPQLSPQTSKHSREENVLERNLDISISEPPLKRHCAKSKLCHIPQSDNEASTNFPANLQSPRSLFSQPAIMSKPDLGENSITTLKLARGNILGENSNPSALSLGPTPNLERHGRPASPKLGPEPREDSLIYKMLPIRATITQLPTNNSTSSSATYSSPAQNRGFAIGQDILGPVELLSEQSDYFGDAPSIVPDETPTDSIVAQTQVPHIDGSCFDWTRLPLSAALPRHVQFTRNINWSATPLGPIKDWSFDLRAMCNLIMGSPHPAAMYWGSDYTAIYNEAYIFYWRKCFLEECYFAWSIIPLVGEDGSVVGLYNPAWEKTRRVISERRMLTLREVGEKIATARNMKGFWTQVIKALEYNPFDIPFALLYSVHEDVDSDMSSQRSLTSGGVSQAPCCVLEATIGVPSGHRSAATPLDLNTSEDGFAPYLRESVKLDRPILLTTEKGTLPTELIGGLECVGFGDSCRAAVVIPLHATSRESILGFLVIGVNPRRPYDDDYSLFVELMTRQLATSMASVVLYEEEIRKGQRAARIAAQDRQELSELVNLRTKEAVESERKFTRMAEMAPVGMFIANSQGEITFSNDAWWEISRHPRSDNSAKSWMDSIKDEDRAGVQATWEKLVTQKVNVTKEFRFKTPWQSRHALTDTWALMNCTSLRDGDDNLMSVFGSITDISHQKWAEEFQKKKTQEAIELKRQQENFIDMTSHEMRNPLSAILQCSDEITSALTIDAAQTIALCAQHQKRIVDDILTLSKLDSALLVVAPVSTQPVSVARRAIKMFEGDMEKHDISIDFQIRDSYSDLGISWVRLDPSRLLQVLINLLTNAIKFTTGQPQRSILVSIGAAKERPAGDDTTVQYFPSRSGIADLTTDEVEWGTGENLYLKFAVQDTGRGLDEKEVSILFQRFSQASPRTHVQYGGSGLGLFISRELTELQGGQIGVSSEKGIGSCFAFYVKARRVEHAPQTSPLSTPNQSAISRKPSLRITNLATAENAKSLPEKPLPAQSTGETSMSISRVSPSPKVDYKHITILIVEDNLVNQRVLQKQLHRAGFVTELSNHGLEALHKLEASSFWKHEENTGDRINISCVLMDLEMPIMDGLTCTKKIRALEADGTIVRHVPIIAVTANARLEQIETALSTGMDDVVSKPFRMPDLIPKVEALVAKSQDIPKPDLE
ncbi:hypothetical protein DID88_008879 [Monilinia fructigena]|uniref:Histidine kinase n=1 Tax=Monilinia fructigena TaxID=38457 RepID=A0A395J762_9HELO|nr:hypothetical protein DID88_008879 [Monilinia fructigena]